MRFIISLSPWASNTLEYITCLVTLDEDDNGGDAGLPLRFSLEEFGGFLHLFHPRVVAIALTFVTRARRLGGGKRQKKKNPNRGS